jgi:hypothetical protein
VSRTDPTGLDAVALAVGDRVRFRNTERGTWKHAVVLGRERDGSIGLRDDKGAFRAIPAERLEVLVRGRREVNRWVPVLERAARTEQLRLM